MRLTVILETMTLVIISVEVYGSKFHRCSSVTEIDCINPGLKPKECFCSCLNATINREYLKVDYSSCVDLLHTCSFYKLWMSITFKDENKEYVAGTEIAIYSDGKKTSQIIPLYKLTNMHEPSDRFYTQESYIKLKINKQYIVSIQPKCTICDRCDYLEDMVLQAVLPEKNQQPKTESNSLPTISISIVVIASVLVVTIVCVIVVFFIRRYHGNMTNNSSPSLIQPNNNNIAYQQKTVNIIPLLGTESHMVDELEKWTKNKSDCHILNPTDMVIKSSNGQCSINTNVLSNTSAITFIILSQSLVLHLLEQCQCAAYLEDNSLVILHECISQCYTHVYFVTFEKDLKLTLINFGTKPIIEGVRNKLFDLSGSPIEKANQYQYMLYLLQGNSISI